MGWEVESWGYHGVEAKGLGHSNMWKRQGVRECWDGIVYGAKNGIYGKICREEEKFSGAVKPARGARFFKREKNGWG